MICAYLEPMGVNELLQRCQLSHHIDHPIEGNTEIASTESERLLHTTDERGDLFQETLAQAGCSYLFDLRVQVYYSEGDAGEMVEEVHQIEGSLCIGQAVQGTELEEGAVLRKLLLHP